MRRKTFLLLAVLAAGLLLVATANAQVTAQTADDPPALDMIPTPTQAEIVASKSNDMDNLILLGEKLFTLPFNKADGVGDGPYYQEFPSWMPGNRPTLQGPETLFLRVNGLDSQSCNECHSIVSHATMPPMLGIAGVGGIVQSDIILPTLIDVADSFDDRVVYMPGHVPNLDLWPDGVADYNGRFANAPFLFGGGGVELLAKEMTQDLQNLYSQALQAPAGTITQLSTHNVYFGYITTIAFFDVDLHLEGVGPMTVDPNDERAALVVAPFGRKGERFSMRDFDRGAMQFHFGLQPVEVFGTGMDPDHDGVYDEISVGQMSLLHIFSVNNSPPIQEKETLEVLHGKELFKELGCVDCHMELTTYNRLLPLSYPELAENPWSNVYKSIDLSTIGFLPDPNGNGVLVPLYSDLKRHNMGPRLMETAEHGVSVRNEEFITARLWGAADTAPYLHDGRATSLYQAIEFHGGEAQGPRDHFLGLSVGDQKYVIAFLRSLRTPMANKADILMAP